MDFNKFVIHLKDVIETNDLDVRAVALRVRELVREALTSVDFKISCSEIIISSLEQAGDRWRNPPLIVMKEHELAVPVFFWPPKSKNSPHLHDSWTVTGVLHRAIQVSAFKSAELDLNRLQIFEAGAGDVGYLFPPSMHSIENVSTECAATFHVFKGKDAPAEARDKTVMRHEQSSQTSKTVNIRSATICVLTEILGSIKDVRTRSLIDRLFACSKLEGRREMVRSLLCADPLAAYELGRRWQQGLTGRNRDILGRFNEELADALPYVDREQFGENAHT